MKPFAKDFFSFLLIIFILLWYGPDILAQSADIRVENIRPQLIGDSLLVSAEFRNLFSSRIEGTIQSGLPSIIELQIQLLQGEKKQIFRKQTSRTIEFDIWEERYTIRSIDTTRVFSEFEELKKACGRIQNEVLGEKKLLVLNAGYVIQIRIGIVPISAGQANKVSDWLQNPNQTEEVVAADERASGFRLNLNKLVSFFVSNKKGSQFRSKWFSSQPFRLNELQQ